MFARFNCLSVTRFSADCAFQSSGGATDEKNESLKSLIRKKVAEYLDRAEKLKESLSVNEEKRSRSAVGANGKISGSGGGSRGEGGKDDEGDDPDVKKLRAGLTSTFSYPISTAFHR